MKNRNLNTIKIFSAFSWLVHKTCQRVLVGCKLAAAFSGRIAELQSTPKHRSFFSWSGPQKAGVDMKRDGIAVGFVVYAIVGLALAMRDQPAAYACNSSPPCIVMTNGCLKTMVLGKATPLVIVLPPAVPVTFFAPATLVIVCPTNNCGGVCPGGAVVPTNATLTITLYPFPGGAQSPVALGTISMGVGTTNPLSCAFNAYSVPVTIPASTQFGVYSVIGTAAVNFSDGTVLTQTGDTLVCLVEPAPGKPSVPRLDMKLLTDPFPQMAPGDQSVTRYRIINNDTNYTVTNLIVFAASKQVAVRPQGGNETMGVYAISNPYGDDFPILFGDNTNCVPLPPHPYHQAEISMALPDLPPGSTNIIAVRIRSWGQCRSGSCSESTLRLEGTFSDGTNTVACAGIAHFVNTNATVNCGGEIDPNFGTPINDLNTNGVYDADDIFNGVLHDSNHNAMPDEFELVLPGPPLTRLFDPAQVFPQVVFPGQSIKVTSFVASAHAPVIQVLANGQPLTTSDGQLWHGQIPADSRSGPQTVYVQGMDANGVLATTIGVYNVAARPSLSIVLQGNSVLLSWPTNTPPLQLQGTPFMGNAITWSPLTNPPPAVVNGRYVRTFPVQGNMGFFRLSSM